MYWERIRTLFKNALQWIKILFFGRPKKEQIQIRVKSGERTHNLRVHAERKMPRIVAVRLIVVPRDTARDETDPEETVLVATGGIYRGMFIPLRALKRCRNNLAGSAAYIHCDRYLNAKQLEQGRLYTSVQMTREEAELGYKEWLPGQHSPQWLH